MSVNGVGGSSNFNRAEKVQVEKREESAHAVKQRQAKAAQKSEDTQRASEKGDESKVDLTA